MAENCFTPELTTKEIIEYATPYPLKKPLNWV